MTRLLTSNAITDGINFSKLLVKRNYKKKNKETQSELHELILALESNNITSNRYISMQAIFRKC